jgi:4-hydroxybenzoate polyprenyltransferase
MYISKSDEILALFVQIIALALVFIISIVVHKHKWELYFISVILMVAANIISQIKIAHDGPGAVGGFILFPVYGVILAFLGTNLSKFFIWTTKKLKKQSK